MTRRFKEPVIVFGGGINGLGITRNLGNAGIRVYMVTERLDPAAFSRRCHKRIIIPNFSEREDLVKSFLENFSRKTSSRPVIFSTDDIGTLMLSKLANTLRDDYIFVMPNREVAETLVDKRKFYNSLTKEAIPFPRVYTLDEFGSIENLKKRVRYPLFIRPSISPRFGYEFKRKGFVAANEKELCYYYSLASRRKIDVLFQEIIFGPTTLQFGISGLFGKSGEPLAFFGYHRLRSWPVMFGNSSLMESWPISELLEIQNVIIRYLRSIGYRGIMDAEFKKDTRDKQFKLLEVNARSWWQNSFPTKCGQNIILKAYLDAIGQKIKPSEEYAVGKKWVDAAGDVRSSIQNGGIMGWKWLKSLSGIRDFAFFDFSDPLPLLSRLLCIAATSAQCTKADPS
jgi:predicted ATP-grasp superfamily ATP-dependent carboligase